MADQAVRLGPAPARESYLRGDLLLAAARTTGATAIHPGYGFLSEDAGFARDIEEAGIAFIGPTPEQLEVFGSKHTARAKAVETDLEQETGLRPGVGFDWNNGRLTSVSVTFPRLVETKPVRELADTVRAAVAKEFKQTPENIVLAFSLRAAPGTTAQAGQTH